MTPETSLDDLVRARSVIACVGTGGVGKTTASAAIAMAAAQAGRTVCVLTIDPARRLANAMGLSALGNTAARVGDDRFEAAGLPRPAGQLWAMMLDTKRTWDDLVKRFALDDAQAQRIFDNHYYQQISSALAGSQEFMAMEKLYELHESGLYDLLVLDTPPTRHALDFLDAPQKMIGFMDEGVLKVLTAPTRLAGRLGFGMLKLSTAMMFALLQRITGFQVLNDIADFVVSFSGMHSGFRERARRVEEYLRSSRASFVLVTSPSAQTVDEAIVFFRKLRESSMPFGGFIVNRVHADGLEDPGAAAEWERLKGNPGLLTEDPGLAARLIDNFAAYQLLAEADAAQIRRLHEACGGPHFWRTVPAFDVDIHDLSGLAQVNESLFDR